MPEEVDRQFDAKDSNGVGIVIVCGAVVGLSMFWQEKARKAVSHAIIVRRISTSGAKKNGHILVNGQPPGHPGLQTTATPRSLTCQIHCLERLLPSNCNIRSERIFVDQ